jgi:hypothetical protein
MNASIKISKGNYGFNYNWSLMLSNEKVSKTFYLGQDVKVCKRMLQMEPRDVVKAIGTAMIETEAGNKKLTRFILKTLKEKYILTPAKILKLNEYDLIVE